MSEENMAQAIFFGHEQIRQDRRPDRATSATRLSWAPREFPPLDQAILSRHFKDRFYTEFSPIEADSGKHARAEKIRRAARSVFGEFLPERRSGKYRRTGRVRFPSPGRTRGPATSFSKARAHRRPGPKDLRQITCEVGVLPAHPRVRRSFQRGETQALVTTTPHHQPTTA